MSGPEPAGRRFRAPVVALGLAMLMLALAVVSVGVGPVPISPGKTLRVLVHALPGVGAAIDVTDVPPEDAEIILSIRPPRVVVAVLVGVALALAGTIMQGFFQNPMADPYIIGVSSGAGFGATLAVALGLHQRVLGMSMLSAFAFAGSVGVTLLVYTLARRGGRVPTGTLLLTGVAVGAMVSAVTSLMLLYRTNDLKPLVQWLMGSLAGRQWSHALTILPYVAIGAPLALMYARDLNAMLAGDEPAMHLGVDVGRTRLALLVLAAALASAAVAVAGVIGFVGLVVPHISRLLVGPDHRRLLPVAALGGAVLLLIADLLSRTMPGFQEVPVGIVTSVLGCPFFLLLLCQSRQTRF
ncbi:MAG TPA: iron chelate uptake ABC transporter family permease subunit [Armatimonadota bacterium]|nr:iron chelate uptake ABC transporter family permease subunit [Armatimonadota bacterium]